MQLPMLGTSEQTGRSKFQVTLVDKTDKNLHPMDYPRINRFFENIADRDAFVTMFEASIIKTGGRLVLQDRYVHPLFTTFHILDKLGVINFEITVYH